MNMKKTIAAIAAGAVAVSAMATTVSAVQSGTLNYNLVNTIGNQNNAKVTLKATFPNIKLVAGTNVEISVPHMGWGDKIVVSGQYIDTNKNINPISFTHMNWDAGYSDVTNGMIDDHWNNGVSDVKSVSIPVKAVNDGTVALIGGAAVASDGTAGIAAVATATYKGFAVATNIDTIKANNIPAGTYALTYQAAADAVPEVAAGWVFGGDPTATPPVAPTKVTDTELLNTLNALKESTPNKTVYEYNGTDYTYSAGEPAKPAKDEGFFVTVGGTTYSAADFGIAKIDGAAANDKITVVYTAGTDAEPGTEVVMANLTVTVTMLTANDTAADGKAKIEGIHEKLNSKYYGIQMKNGADAAVWGDATTSAYSASTPYRAPFMTQVNDTDVSYANIINYLQTAKVNGTDKSYVNVRAVLNDAIENFETVTFTFNTAADKVKFARATGTKLNPTIVNDSAKNNYTDAAKELTGTQFIIGIYDGDGTDVYQAFGDHTYDWYYSPEGSGYVGMDWGGQNLFAGALIVNEGYTMSLSNTEYFDWTKTAISFDWDAIMDGAATTNNYATYVHSLKLATSQYWFWDSMDVVLVAGDADTVDADAAAEVDENTIDDDEDDEIDAGDEDEDVEPADEDEDEDVAPVAAEPAPVVANPPTGNASVALAVIPVALAAAAIVAKKRG